MVWSTKMIYKCHDVDDGTCKKKVSYHLCMRFLMPFCMNFEVLNAFYDVMVCDKYFFIKKLIFIFGVLNQCVNDFLIS